MTDKEMKKKARAFVLLEVEQGKEEEVTEKLLKFAEVREVHIITGENDMLVVLETEREILVPSSQGIHDFVRHKIGKMAGVQETETIIPTHSRIKGEELTIRPYEESDQFWPSRKHDSLK